MKQIMPIVYMMEVIVVDLLSLQIIAQNVHVKETIQVGIFLYEISVETFTIFHFEIPIHDRHFAYFYIFETVIAVYIFFFFNFQLVNARLLASV